MTEPTIISSGKYQLAKLQFQGREPILGIRENKDSSWILTDSPAIPYLFALLATVNDYVWLDFLFFFEENGSKINLLSRDKGASSQQQTKKSDMGPIRDILVGEGVTWYDIRFESRQDALDMQSAALAALNNFAQMVPIDADSSEMSKGVDYGRA